MPTRVTRISALASLLLALAAGLWLALWPCAYQEAEQQAAPGGTVQQHQRCVSLIEANGVDVIGVAALPVLLAGMGLVAVHAGRRGILAITMVAVAAFCILALASVGMLSAAFAWERLVRATSVPPAARYVLGAGAAQPGRSDSTHRHVRMMSSSTVVGGGLPASR